jgi:hypothetical protein
MLTLNISEADIEHVEYERIQYPLARIRVRFDALYITRYTLHEVIELTGLHRNTLTSTSRKTYWPIVILNRLTFSMTRSSMLFTSLTIAPKQG